MVCGAGFVGVPAITPPVVCRLPDRSRNAANACTSALSFSLGAFASRAALVADMEAPVMLSHTVSRADANLVLPSARVALSSRTAVAVNVEEAGKRD